MIFLLAICCALLLLMTWNMMAWPAVSPSRETCGGTVSILIPARNEEFNIGRALEHARSQAGGVLEILVYDDHSTDRTAEIVREHAARDARVRLIPGRPLAEGWCGKPFACACLAGEARADWLLFLDADAVLQPEAVSRIVSEAVRRDVTLLSCWPGLEMRTFWEKVFMPLLNHVVFTLFPAPLSLTLRLPALGLAHGACILMQREAYGIAGGHARVRTELFEDTALARAWREAGLHGLCLDGQRVVRVRMYDSLGAIWTGFQKNVYPAFKHEVSFWLFLVFHFTCFVLPFVIACAEAAGGRVSAAAWGAAGAVLVSRLCQAWRFRHPPWSILLHPFAECALLAVGLVSWYKCHGGAGVVWKGRSYRGANT